MKGLFLLLITLLIVSCHSDTIKNTSKNVLLNETPCLNEDKIIGKWIITSMFYDTKKKRNKGALFYKKRLLNFTNNKNDSLIVSFNSNHEIIYNDTIIGKWNTYGDRTIHLTRKIDSTIFPIPLDNKYEYCFPYKEGMKFRIPFFNDKGVVTIYLSYNLLKYENFIEQ